MKNLKTVLLAASAFALTACGGGQAAETPVKAAAQAVKDVVVDYSAATTGAYNIDKGHGYIVFNYTHQGYSTPYLRWKNWDSTLNWNAENPESSTVNVSIDVAENIDSGVDVFDDHLRAERWFNVAAHPSITFVSTAINKTSGSTGTMTGDLTIKGITKPVTLDVVFNKAGINRRSKGPKIGFSAKGNLNRSDWDLGGGVPAISDNVNLIIEAEYDIAAP